MQYCSCEIDHEMLVAPEAVNQVVVVWCPYCQRTPQFTAVMMRDGTLHWMPGDWRPEAEPDLYNLGVYAYN